MKILSSSFLLVALPSLCHGFSVRPAVVQAPSISTIRWSSTIPNIEMGKSLNITDGEPNVVLEKMPFGSPSTTTAKDNSIHVPKGMSHAWEVHKFGGASLATAELYRTVGDLLIQESQGRAEENTGTIPTMAVVSAKGGMTDLLVKVVDCALKDFEMTKQALEEAVSSQIQVLLELVPDQPAVTDPIVARFRQDQVDIWSVVQSLRMIQTVPSVTLEVVSGYGEIWSAQTLYAYLSTHPAGIPTAWLDARDVLIVKSEGASGGLGEKGSAASTGKVCPLWDVAYDKLTSWWSDQAENDLLQQVTKHSGKNDFSTKAPIVVATGFVARTEDGVPTTLKRSGSDYSATIFAKLLEAGRVTMWKNTDGVYTADPRVVPEAFPIQSLKYDEAMELAYFGAQVLHPSAMEPCIDKQIPVYVRNIFNPAFPGTVICGRCGTLTEANLQSKDRIKSWLDDRHEGCPIKGITSVNKVATVTLEGATLAGSNMASRALGALARNGISVLIVTQASSESSITLAVPQEQADRAVGVLRDSFELELSRAKINSISSSNDLSIVAIIGEGMANTVGVASTFLNALARSNVNVRLIAQGSSERQLAVVVDKDDAARAMRAAHMAFTLQATTASVTILGATGTDGQALIKQLQKQHDTMLNDMGVDISVHLAACKTKMVTAKDAKGLGLELEKVRQYLKHDDIGEPFDLEKISEVVKTDISPFRVVIDCTTSEKVGDYYEDWLSNGIHIISPSRHVGSGDLDRYKRIMKARHGHETEWFQSSGVGSALPILSTIQDLIETGDEFKTISGALSESLAFILDNFNETVPFSEAVRIASERGYMEKNLCDDLSGYDTAMKMVIVARKIGMDISLGDIEIESLLPEECALDMDSVLSVLPKLDGVMLERKKAAEAKGLKLRHKFVIDKVNGKCWCGLAEVPPSDPVHRLGSDENLVVMDTERYSTSPLIIKGAAAGPDLTAAAIFADLLRLTRAYAANHGTR